MPGIARAIDIGKVQCLPYRTVWSPGEGDVAETAGGSRSSEELCLIEIAESGSNSQRNWRLSWVIEMSRFW